jgi:hypothetical protein
MYMHDVFGRRMGHMHITLQVLLTATGSTIGVVVVSYCTSCCCCYCSTTICNVAHTICTISCMNNAINKQIALCYSTSVYAAAVVQLAAPVNANCCLTSTQSYMDYYYTILHFVCVCDRTVLTHSIAASQLRVLAVVVQTQTHML